MIKIFRSHIIIITLITLFLSGVSCTPNPRRQLSESERVADMQWLLTKIEANYAPLEYKQELFDFNFESLRLLYLERAELDQSNEKFYLLMHKLVAQFADGHMGLRSTRSSLPGRAEIAYLGFSGKRRGENFHVGQLLPSFELGHNYPIRPGDQIVKKDGRPLREIVESELVRYRNVGQNEANLTLLMPRLFSKSSLTTPLPKPGSDVVLTVKRGSREFEVTVPWIIVDHFDFEKAQEESLRSLALQKGIDFDNQKNKLTNVFQFAASHPHITQGRLASILRSSTDANQAMQKVFEIATEINSLDTFEFQQNDPIETIITFYQTLKKQIDRSIEQYSAIEKLKNERYVPSQIFSLPHATNYPSYIAIIEEDEQRKAVGYIQLHTFSPTDSEREVIDEVKETLNYFKNFGAEGVRHIVIDMIDNGGGSLRLGMKLAQLFSADKIRSPSLKVRLNDSWMDSTESSIRGGSSDAHREIARRLFEKMENEFYTGNLLSSAFNIEQMYPFALNGNRDLTLFDRPYQFDILIITNETCASMCDIFAAILKDNELAITLGEKTMGAGGNVVNHVHAPHSGMTLNLTESLILSPNGEFLENNGVQPDIHMNVNEYSHEKYQTVIERAFEEVLKI